MATARRWETSFNGNRTYRLTATQADVYSYGAENHLTEVKRNGVSIATFTYDGDGARVKGVVNGVTTSYVGNNYEVSGGVVRKYYYAGNQRIAMREGTNPHLWLFNDHLGSTGYTYNATTKQGELRYKPFGSTRYTWGNTPTSYRYTGQREENALGLYYYGARWYDPGLGRFIQPDTIVPGAGNPQAYDRYAYTLNNPLKYNDPTGHYSDQEIMDNFGCETWQCVEAHFQEGGTHAGLWGWLDVLQAGQDGDIVDIMAIYGNQAAHMTGQFATVQGQIVVNNFSIQIGNIVNGQIDAPASSSTIPLSEQAFAGTALIGSGAPQTQHNAFYSSKHGTSAYNSRLRPDCQHHDCVTQVLDGTSTLASSIAVGCAYMALAPCLATASTISTGASGLGAAWTTFNVISDNGTALDGAVTMGTLKIGAKYGTRGNAWVGLVVSLAQWGWDNK